MKVVVHLVDGGLNSGGPQVVDPCGQVGVNGPEVIFGAEANDRG